MRVSPGKKKNKPTSSDNASEVASTANTLNASQPTTSNVSESLLAAVNALLNQQHFRNNNGRGNYRYNNRNYTSPGGASGGGGYNNASNNTQGKPLVCSYHTRFGKDAFSCDGLWCTYPVANKIPFPYDTRQVPHPGTNAVWTRMPAGASQRSHEEQKAHRVKVLQNRRQLMQKGNTAHASANVISSASTASDQNFQIPHLNANFSNVRCTGGAKSSTHLSSIHSLLPAHGISTTSQMGPIS